MKKRKTARKLPLAKFRRIKNELLEVLKNRGGRGHMFTRTDFEYHRIDALKELKAKRANKRQIARFKYLIEQVAQNVPFNPYTGD